MPGEHEAIGSWHATAIAMGGRGALIRGPSGAGKSDLALRCLAHPSSELLPDPVQLISDDQVILERCGDRILLSTPSTIVGQIEVRGLGIVSVKNARNVPLCLVVDIVGSLMAVERLPDPRQAIIEIGGCLIPRIALHAFEVSAATKVLIALRSMIGISI